jgi:excinuclease ABC subunit C
MVVTDEKEALLLENHLIKKHQPRFNVKLRDDKQYLVLRVRPPVTSPGAPPHRQFPRVEVARNIRDDGARYFGPYHSATSCRETLRVLNRHFQLRTCTDHVLEHRGRVCLQYQIKRCSGPCAVPVEPAAYAEQVDDVVMFLEGRDRELVGACASAWRRGPPPRTSRSRPSSATRSSRSRRPCRGRPSSRTTSSIRTSSGCTARATPPS